MSSKTVFASTLTEASSMAALWMTSESLAWLLTIGTPAESISSRRSMSKLVTPMWRIFDPFTCHPVLFTHAPQ